MMMSRRWEHLQVRCLAQTGTMLAHRATMLAHRATMLAHKATTSRATGHIPIVTIPTLSYPESITQNQGPR
jgi:hypothetical protein